MLDRWIWLMLGIRVNQNLETRLEHLCDQTGRSKSYYVRQALENFLEDKEDYLLGIAALERKESTISLAQLERQLGLEG